ncbi:MAG: hypothetical protein J0I12_34735 [Candidatus Eremiobacteraeota bacterium]|nr:hypothetical protein [Candidatus Eremiobacteraeota bacterium]
MGGELFGKEKLDGFGHGKGAAGLLAHGLQAAFQDGHLVGLEVAAELAARGVDFGLIRWDFAPLRAGDEVFDLGVGVVGAELGPFPFRFRGGYAYDFSEFGPFDFALVGKVAQVGEVF